jgi:hypothetical protein
MSVERKSRRNAKMMSTTRMPPTRACSWTLLMARSMKSELSCITSMWTFWTSAFTRATSALTPLATEIVFLPGLLLDLSWTPGLPLMRMKLRRSSVLSLTSAMSRM